MANTVRAAILHRRRIKTLLPAVLMLTCAPPNGRPIATSEAPTTVMAPVDSATAVRLAIEALRPADESYALRVTKFERRGDAFVIELLPEIPKDPAVDVSGGGGVVEVAIDRTVTVLRRYR